MNVSNDKPFPTLPSEEEAMSLDPALGKFSVFVTGYGRERSCQPATIIIAYTRSTWSEGIETIIGQAGTLFEQKFLPQSGPGIPPLHPLVAEAIRVWNEKMPAPDERIEFVPSADAISVLKSAGKRETPAPAWATAEPLLRFFTDDDDDGGEDDDDGFCLPTFDKLACRIAENVPRSSERTVALRKLLEAKDAIRRALVVADED